MDSTGRWQHIDEHRRRLVALLEGLNESQWATPSLCDGWRVRDVAAHLTDAEARLADVFGSLARARFDLAVMIRDRALSNTDEPDALVARIRAMIGSRRHAVGVTPRETLLDVLVHSQDIAIPLGLDLPMEPDAAVDAIERVLTMPRRLKLWRTPGVVTYVATDVSWRFGAGPEVHGSTRWLLLALTGRTGALDHLEGATERLRPA